VSAYAPVEVTATTDVRDRALARQRAALEALRSAPSAVGVRAYERFEQEGSLLLRSAFLTVAARAAPERTVPALVGLFETYDPKTGLALRQTAIELLCEVDPERALALLGPVLREKRPSATRPPEELLVRLYARALKSRGKAGDADELLPDLAADIARAPDARYAALEALADLGGERGRRALEQVLLEPSSDGHMRRKAVQALERRLSPAELCPLIEHAARHNSDEALLRFLAGVVERLCP
jgi:HEAT repeat protein